MQNTFILKSKFSRLLYLIIVAPAFFYCGCKKDNSSPAPGPGPAPAKPANVVFFLKQDCNSGNVNVTCNNISHTIRDYNAGGADCDDSAFASYKLLPGTYHFVATGSTLKWESDVTVTAGDGGKCKQFALTCDGVTTVLKGYAGTPRFFLKHSTGVDFDLHIVTPDGSEINNYTTKGQNGSMDLQSNCLGNDDSYGFTGLTSTIENVWWPYGVAAHGTYKFWVQYSNYCGPSIINGSYTLQVLDGMSALKTYSGTLTGAAPKSVMYTFDY